MMTPPCLTQWTDCRQICYLPRSSSVGGWTREQFYQWTTDYLRFLWYSDDPSLPLLALNALRPVLEYDAELGLSVLTTRPKGKTGSFGGKGVTVQEVLIFLESTNPKSTILNRSTATPKRSIVTTSSTTANTGSLKIPLVNGRAVGVTYLGRALSSIIFYIIFMINLLL